MRLWRKAALDQGGIRGCDVAVQVGSAERLFAALFEGGRVQMLIGETFNCVRFGMLTDKLGVPWMVNCE
jgi:PhnB protein